VTLLQAVANLLENAFKFVPAGKPASVRLFTEDRDGMVRVWVEDRGIGIPPEERERIFHVFERLHGIEPYPGTGIGLAIVKKAAERMGGQVGVEPNPEGGSRFWIGLPRAGP
jgi:signal transduction histidine kinase